jgi:predicted PurR-regulated permease PerM
VIKLPEYYKMAQILLGLVGLVFILYVGQDIIVPIVFALILAILLNPLVNTIHGAGVNRVIAIIIAMLAMVAVLFGIFYFIAAQLSMFSEALPELRTKTLHLFEDLMDWVSHKFRVPQDKIHEWITSKKESGLETAGQFVGSTLISLSGILVATLLVPVYIFLFLFYKPLLLDFCSRAFKSETHSTVAEVLFNTKTLVQSYLMGLLIEMLIIATLDSVALLIIGVDYAIVLGVIGSILNILPYVGGMLAVGLSMLMAFITGSGTQALFVLLAFVIIQLLDNNFIVPLIVASKVQLNALVSIVAVLIGGAIWGVAGMFLSIPLTAILKVIFDRVDSLKPYGFLIGDSMPRIGEDIFRMHILQRAYERNKMLRKLAHAKKVK